jgi:hypothetical protein
MRVSWTFPVWVPRVSSATVPRSTTRGVSYWRRPLLLSSDGSVALTGRTSQVPAEVYRIWPGGG